MAPIPGWYADPTGRGELRYWDGNACTKNRAKAGEETMTESSPPRKKAARPRSEICFVNWVWKNSTAEDRKTRKAYPYEIWFVASAIGPNGLYRAAESDCTFYDEANYYYYSGHYGGFRGSGPSHLPRHEYSEASLNDLVKKLWADGWEPSSGGGKGSLWYEYRFRRPVSE
jgi:hypothetical protein